MMEIKKNFKTRQVEFWYGSTLVRTRPMAAWEVSWKDAPADEEETTIVRRGPNGFESAEPPEAS